MLALLFILLSTKKLWPCVGQAIIDGIKHLIPLHTPSLSWLPDFFFIIFEPEDLGSHLLNDLFTNYRQVSRGQKAVI